MGWVAFNKDDVMKAGKMFYKAARTLEQIGATKTADYLTTLHNLALAYEKRQMYEKCDRLYQTILRLYETMSIDTDGALRRTIAVCYVSMLLEAGKTGEAMDFITCEDQRNVRVFGQNSIQRIDFLQQAGSHLKVWDMEECMDLYRTARRALKDGGHQRTVYQARLLNYVGVCYADFYEDYGYALELFQSAKKLFEAIGETQDELYPMVLSNIVQAEDQQNAK